MSKIRVDTEGISDLRGRVTTIERSMDEIAAQIASAGRQLDMETAGSGDIRGRVERLQRRAAQQEEKARQYANALGMVNDRFASSDRTIAGQARDINYLMDQILMVQNTLIDNPVTQMTLEIGAELAALTGMLGYFSRHDLFPHHLEAFDCPQFQLYNPLQDNVMGGVPPFLSGESDPLALPGIMLGLATAEHFINSAYFSGSLSGPGATVETEPGSVSAEVYLGKGHGEFGIGGVGGQVNAYVGKAEGEAKLEFFNWGNEKKQEFKDGKWSDSESEKFTVAEVKLGGEAAVVAGDVTVSAGDGMLGVEGNADGTLGSATLKGGGEFSVGKDGINANASGSAMIAAAEGEASGTFSIFGMDIKLKAGGYAGAVGVEGKAGIEDGKFVLEGGGAAVVGGKVGIEIGFNEEGIENIKKSIETVKDGIETVQDAASDMWDDAQEFGEKAVQDLKNTGEAIHKMGSAVGDAVEDGWKNAQKGAEKFGKNVSDFFKW